MTANIVTRDPKTNRSRDMMANTTKRMINTGIKPLSRIYKTLVSLNSSMNKTETFIKIKRMDANLKIDTYSFHFKKRIGMINKQRNLIILATNKLDTPNKLKMIIELIYPKKNIPNNEKNSFDLNMISLRMIMLCSL